MAVLAVAAAAAIGELRHRADQSREAQSLLARLETGVNRLDNLAWLALAERGVSPDLAHSAESIRGQTDRMLADLDSLSPGIQAFHRIREQYRSYVSALDNELRLVSEGKPAEAQRANAERGGAASDEFSKLVREASEVHGDRARRATRQANVGSAAVLTAAAILIGLLLWRYDRARREAHSFAVEGKALQASEERFRALVQNASDAIVIVDPQGRIQYATASATRVLGRSPEELLGKGISDVANPEDAAKVQGLLARCVRRPERLASGEFRLHLGATPSRQIEAIGNNQLGNPSIGGIVMTCRDVSERKRTGEQMQRAAALAAVGQLASGAAHNFNNILAVIIGRAELLARQIEGEAVHRGLEIILKAAQDGSATVRRLQAFTRKKAQDVAQPVVVDDLLRDVAEFTRPRWGDDARARGVDYEVVLDLGSAPSAVKASASELREVFTNLAINALDAMPGGGSLAVRSSVEGGQVVVSIADTGLGMSDEVRQRIFEPFYTTKGLAGSGLGLAVSYGIIERHGGTIEVQSEPGSGSVFMVALPVCEPVAEKSVPSSVARRSGVRALVVDDEAMVREMLAEMLGELGFEVISAASGPEGLSRLEGAEYDFVFTDLSMPGMDGWSVARRVREMRPRAHVILVTGYGDTVNLADERARMVDAVISKPFTLTELDSAIRHCGPRSAVTSGMERIS